MADLPLTGIRVVEFTHMVMGPTCGLVLADLGADVIKVEPTPDGDNTRRLAGTGAGFFITYNRNKQSIAVDIKAAEGLDLICRLIDTADVVLENFRPGALEKLGLGYKKLAATNPRLIYCSLKGFLPGPYEHRAALDEVVQMMGGLAYMTGPPGRPLRAGASVNDMMGGMFGAIAILAAIVERTRTGVGQQVMSALFENNTFLVGSHMAQAAVTGKAPEPMPNRLSAWAVYEIFTTADAEQMFLGVVTDTQWRLFCDAFGLRDLLDDPELATNRQRVHVRERFIPRIAEAIGRLTKAEMIALCEKTGLPYAPIATPQDLFDDLHLAASGGLLDTPMPDGRRTRLPALPIRMGDRQLTLRLPPPAIGAHSAGIAASLGYDADTIAEMTRKGIIGGPTEA